jgi:chromosome segregation ATPase
LEEALANAGTGQDLDEARAKLKLIKGVLYWRLDAAFKARVYAKRRELRALDASLNEAQNRWVRVQSARQSVPNDTGEFAARIAALAQRISALKAALASAGQRQNGYLVELSQNELGAQKGRLAAYEVEARFALADIYDRASTPKTPAPAPPAPGEEAAPDDSGSAPQDAPAPMPVPDSGTAPAPAPGTPP